MNSSPGPTGVAPYTVVFGRIPPTVGEVPPLCQYRKLKSVDEWVDSRAKVIRDMREELQALNDKMAEKFDKFRLPPVPVKVGDWVFVDQRDDRTKLLP